MSLENNKALVRHFIEDIYAGDPSRLDELIAKDYVDHCHWRTLDGLKRLLTAYQAAYPKLEFTIQDMIAEGDKVAARFELTAQVNRSRSVLRLFSESMAGRWWSTGVTALFRFTH